MLVEFLTLRCHRRCDTSNKLHHHRTRRLRNNGLPTRSAPTLWPNSPKTLHPRFNNQRQQRCQMGVVVSFGHEQEREIPEISGGWHTTGELEKWISLEPDNGQCGRFIRYEKAVAKLQVA